MALNAATAIRGTNLALGSPADIFDISAPLIGSEAPKAASIDDGDATVSTQTGALSYAFPISVPAGRFGAQPHLALGYGSQAPIYGTEAAGWALNIPAITLDTSEGRLEHVVFAGNDKRYKSALAGDRRLVHVTELDASGHDINAAINVSAWRADGDSSYTRYQLTSTATGTSPPAGYWWRAFSPDGTTFYFGDTDHVQGGSGCSGVVSDEYAPLTRSVDQWGNAVDYWYGLGDAGDCRIEKITWGENANASIGAFAAVTFNYASTSPTCGGLPVGALTSYRTGTRIVTGASELDSIVVTSFPPLAYSASEYAVPLAVDHTRTIALTYDSSTQSTNRHGGCFRQLLSVTERAQITGQAEVALPPITFSYGPSDFGTGGLTWVGPYSAHNPFKATGADFSGPISNLNFNLSWGYRYKSQWPSIESMLVDVDGDGRLDRVINSPATDAQGRTVTCGAVWERNLGGYDNFTSNSASFDEPRPLPLPTLKWGMGDDITTCTGAFDGASAANVGTYATTTHAIEGCHLNYQVTNYRNSAGQQNTCPSQSDTSCPAPGYCNNHRDCSDAKATDGAFTYLAYRWYDADGDGLVDLVASPVNPSGSPPYDLQWGTGINLSGANGGRCAAQQEPDKFGFGTTPPDTNCPNPSYHVDPSLGTYQMCSGMYPYIYYINHGNGVLGKFDSGAQRPDYIRYEPAPLETMTADSTLNALPAGQTDGFIDVDGDGSPDAVHTDFATGSVAENPNIPGWAVYRNDRKGSLLPAVADVAYPFLWAYDGSAATSQLNTTDPALQQNGNTYTDVPVQSQGTVDLNGDGLPDHWLASSDRSSATVAFNDGAQFGRNAGATAVVTPRPGTDGYSSNLTVSTTIDSGYRWDRNRLFDVDSDGRPDMLQTHYPTQDAHFDMIASFNQGGQFSSNPDQPFITGLPHYIVASCTPQNNCSTFWWEQRADLVDLDGDGIPEGLDFNTDLNTNRGVLDFEKIATPSNPPRLLHTIDKGRGAVTTISYATTANSPTVVQHTMQSDPKYMPHTQWVVSNVTTVDTIAATESSTSYQYTDPVFNADDHGLYAFRGFDEVHTTLPSGAIRVDRYSYTPDWSGRLETTLMIPAEHPDEVRAIDETHWVELDLFDGTVPSYVAAETGHTVCKNGQNETACRQNADTVSLTLTTFAAEPSPQHPLLYEPEQEILSSNTGFRACTHLLQNCDTLDGDRLTATTYAALADSMSFRVRPQVTTKQVQNGGVLSTFAHNEMGWDSTLRELRSESVYFDAGSTTDAPKVAVTKRAYDPNTGNMLQRWKPEQNPDTGGNNHSADYTYDSRKLYVSTETLEPNAAGARQVLQYAYEYGTGTRTETLGPNPAPCIGHPNCAGTPQQEDHKIVVDGLGRTIERYETVTPFDETTYLLVKVETNSYVVGVPSSVTHQGAIDGAVDFTGQPVRYTKDETDLDGHGRPVKKIIFAQGAASADSVTTFAYSNDGTLQSVKLPDPSRDDTSVVTFTYTFDSLGRPTSIRRPDSNDAQSGVDMTYNGLTVTSHEIVGAALGNAATTTTTYMDSVA